MVAFVPLTARSVRTELMSRGSRVSQRTRMLSTTPPRMVYSPAERSMTIAPAARERPLDPVVRSAALTSCAAPSAGNRPRRRGRRCPPQSSAGGSYSYGTKAGVNEFPTFALRATAGQASSRRISTCRNPGDSCRVLGLVFLLVAGASSGTRSRNRGRLPAAAPPAATTRQRPPRSTRRRSPRRSTSTCRRT